MADSMWQGGGVDLDAYLERVGHRGDVAADLPTLRGLHAAHVDAIAFDNLDALLGREAVPLDLDSVQEKIVRQGRGGWCLEQVVLMAAVLDRIGFTFTAFAGRTRIRTGSRFGPALHVALCVELDGEHWLHDVSFGAYGPHEPVRLAEHARLDDDWSFDLVREQTGEYVLRFLRPEGPVELYGFTTDVRHPSDFEILNHFCLTHPRSPFNHQMVLQRTQPGVRHILAGSTLTEIRPARPATSRKLDKDELLTAPADIFGIALAPGDVQALRTVLDGP
ncbi:MULTISPECIES: arylamine N-acetyltransferase family protein [Streptomyces]|uniref:arylamine N-acetyltransferase family protein n=1 Tax=Streptomyces TaxID=1883 RepID=UPI0018859C4E|nr:MULTISPECIES: arylamine N-acetyltransferase [Streptomyces]MBZ6130319.1 arylamine N-acetyltransferase [Streptomyces olivaceus]MBZ6249617.1 arylamine N-acetyltransferase [Streptomyces olivaceus]MCU8590681.1 arylamine N-acetyltransferase [Streptomyces sp. A13(2022)]UOG79918.1 arylamine N-acetyltransferase [Streptomyces sp. CB09030]WFB84969.1 arylamine N-acetyltransferase [Streptomyces olivaceus]